MPQLADKPCGEHEPHPIVAPRLAVSREPPFERSLPYAEEVCCLLRRGAHRFLQPLTEFLRRPAIGCDRVLLNVVEKVSHCPDRDREAPARRRARTQGSTAGSRLRLRAQS